MAALVTRPSLHEWALGIASVVAMRGTCARRKVGCVLLDEHGFILSTGYNGVAPGQVHCIDVPCPGATLPTGTGLSRCEALHAEANALLTCPDVHRVRGIYVTCSPCVDCTKLLLRTSARELWYLVPYAHDADARLLWERAGRAWHRLETGSEP